MTLGENITRLRAARGLSQGTLAEALDVSRQSVSKWETDASVPELDKLMKLAGLFGVTLDELVTGEAPAAASAPEPEPRVIVVERERPRETRKTVSRCSGSRSFRSFFAMESNQSCGVGEDSNSMLPNPG